MTQIPKWKLAANEANLRASGLNLSIDVSRPQAGGTLAQLDATGAVQATELALLFGDFFQADASGAETGAITVPDVESVETYCRGVDLISRYPATDTRPGHSEIYWRHWPDALLHQAEDFESDEDAPELFAVEAICSLETDLLASSPMPVFQTITRKGADRWFLLDDDRQWESRSSQDIAECLPVDGQLAVACLTSFESGATLLQTVCPADLLAVSMSTADGSSRWTLAAHFLEKGVIRRMRMFAAMATETVDEKLLFQAAETFYRSELPLTV